MLVPPQLWSYLWTRYVPVPPGLAWSLWKALIRSRWVTTVQWRDAFLSLSRKHAILTQDLVEDYLGDLVTLARLVELVEALMHEKTLAKRDGKAIEEALFAQADHDGAWTH
jgi:hypothetical protein